MKMHRSFIPSDFSSRDTFQFLIIYIVISAICVGVGLLFETITEFWRGLLCGIGLGLSVPLILFYPKKEIDITSFPEPSDNVKMICDDPNYSLVEAIKAYRKETGLGLSEATSVLKAYMSKETA